MIKTKQILFLSFASLFFTFSASADTLDQGRGFFISPQYDLQSRTLVSATLRYISERAYFYVADDYWSGIGEITHNQALAQIETLAREFDDRIYPIETNFFGSEPNPGVDNDVRIIILLTPLIENVGGYFDTANQHLATKVPNSNQREIIYLNISDLANQSKMFAFLAHEFQHLISFNQKENLRNISDDVWLNELRSEYAVTLLGYNDIYDGSHLQRRVRALTENPSDSLTEWKNLPADYGQIGLFGEYVAEHLSPQVIADTLKNKSAGFNSLAESLIKNGHSETFTDIYRDWLIANFLNDGSVNTRFDYTKPALTDFRVVPTRTVANPGENTVLAVSDSLRDWQGTWYDVSQLQSGTNGVLKISFDSPSLASFYIFYLVFNPDGRYRLYDFNPAPGSKELYISGIGLDFTRVVLMPVKKDKLSSFSSNETPVSLTTSFERIASAPLTAPIPEPIQTQISPAPVIGSQPEPGTYNLEPGLSDGTLIRVRGGYKVYVIKDGWRRHIVNSRIFSFYPGLGFEKVIEVDPAVLSQYQESSLVRYAGGEKVYSVDGGARRWLLN